MVEIVKNIEYIFSIMFQWRIQLPASPYFSDFSSRFLNPLQIMINRTELIIKDNSLAWLWHLYKLYKIAETL